MTWVLTGLFTFATSVAVFLLYLIVSAVLRTREENRMPDPDIDWTQLEGDLSEYVRRRNGEAM